MYMILMGIISQIVIQPQNKYECTCFILQWNSTRSLQNMSVNTKVFTRTIRYI